MATPTSTAMVAIPGYPGCYKFDVEQLLKVPVMDWRQHFEMGRQAAKGEWKPDPSVPQVPAALPDPSLMPLSTIHEVERMSGFQVPRLVDQNTLAIAPGTPDTFDPSNQPDDAAAYTTMWSMMNGDLAQRILETGMWDGEPISRAQSQAAFDFIQHNADSGPRQAELVEV